MDVDAQSKNGFDQPFENIEAQSKDVVLPNNIVEPQAKILKLDAEYAQNDEDRNLDDESEYEEISDNDEDDVITTGVIVSNEKKVKKKRKRKNANLRRNIRSVFSDKKLDAATQLLRDQEKERLMRFGLSNTAMQIQHPNLSHLNNLPPNSLILPPFPGNLKPLSKQPVPNKPRVAPEVICLDSDSDDNEIPSSKPNKILQLLERNKLLGKKNEICILSSDSEEEGDTDDFDTVLDKRVQADDYYSELGLHANDELNIPEEESGQVLINVNHSEKDKDIYLSESLSKILKPHQVGGVRFLYDNLIESIHDFRSFEGNGCILAHAMGLGKTIQTITFIDLFLRHSPAKKVLCVVPVNTIQNWVSEFNRWLPPLPSVVKTSVPDSLINSIPASTKVKKGKKPSKKSKQENIKSQKKDIKAEEKQMKQDTFELETLLNDMVEFVDYSIAADSPLTDHQVLHYQSTLPTVHDIQNVVTNHLSYDNNQLIKNHDSTSMKYDVKNHVSLKFVDESKIEMNSSNIKHETNTINNEAIKLEREAMTSIVDIDVKDVLNEIVEKVLVTEATEKLKSTTFREFQLFMVDAQKNQAGRARVIEEWDKVGGVLLIGYEMYRSISMCTSRKKGGKKKLSKDNETNANTVVADLKAAICKPGPDLVVCDEGHRIRNYQSGISQALKSIKTRKRLVLTGYPLQNNLIEYWCMVDFVRPNYLGSRQEFANMFERPIMNGQCVDSTDKDKLLMRQRAHVLFSLLQGFVQRRGHDVLKKSLPSKQEYVLMIHLSPIQKALYRRLIELTKEAYSDSLNPIKTFCLCCKIWNHPDILYNAVQASQQGKLVDIISDEDDIALDDMSTTKPKRKKKPPVHVEPSSNKTYSSSIGFDPFGTEAREMLADIPQWAGSVFRRYPYKLGEIENSGKFVVLKKIIDDCYEVNDRLLVFSQSLFTLSTIEAMLQKSELHKDTTDCWVKGRDYFRLDGSTSSVEREKLINAFNKKDNERTRIFLLSTRAGCLGINLIGANRVVVFDVSWNPCHDAQAICRIYRYGQVKPCFIYRLVSSNTMEKKIYYRQISKQGISDRVVDEMSLTENFSKSEIQSLMIEEWTDEGTLSLGERSKYYKDHILQSLLKTHETWITKAPFKHESLLISETNNKLSGIEKRAAKKAYEQERSMINGGNQPYRSYPLQRNFPQNTPIAPVRPFLWRPPTSLSWLENTNNVQQNVASNVTLSSTSSREMTDQVLRLLQQTIGSNYGNSVNPPTTLTSFPTSSSSSDQFRSHFYDNRFPPYSSSTSTSNLTGTSTTMSRFGNLPTTSSSYNGFPATTNRHGEFSTITPNVGRTSSSSASMTTSTTGSLRHSYSSPGSILQTNDTSSTNTLSRQDPRLSNTLSESYPSSDTLFTSSSNSLDTPSMRFNPTSNFNSTSLNPTPSSHQSHASSYSNLTEALLQARNFENSINFTPPSLANSSVRDNSTVLNNFMSTARNPAAETSRQNNPLSNQPARNSNQDNPLLNQPARNPNQENPLLNRLARNPNQENPLLNQLARNSNSDNPLLNQLARTSNQANPLLNQLARNSNQDSALLNQLARDSNQENPLLNQLAREAAGYMAIGFMDSLANRRLPERNTQSFSGLSGLNTNLSFDNKYVGITPPENPDSDDDGDESGSLNFDSDYSIDENSKSRDKSIIYLEDD